MIAEPSVFKNEKFGYAFLSFIVYFLSTIPLTYLLSNMYNKHSKAQGVILMIYFFNGLLFVISYISPLAIMGSGSLPVIIISHVFCGLSPQFALARAFMCIVNFFKIQSGLNAGTKFS